MDNYKSYLVNHDYKIFTCDHPKNTFVIDTSNGYPVMMTTNVTKKTKWSDIFKGNYELANPDGTPEYLSVNGKKYKYVDAKWATNVMGYKLEAFKNSDIVTSWKSKYQEKFEHFCKKVL